MCTIAMARGGAARAELLAELAIFPFGRRRVIEPAGVDRDRVPVEQPFRRRVAAPLRAALAALHLARLLEARAEDLARILRVLRDGGCGEAQRKYCEHCDDETAASARQRTEFFSHLGTPHWASPGSPKFLPVREGRD